MSSPTLRDLRKSAGLTLVKLSELTGIPSTTLSSIERGMTGASSLSPERLAGLCGALCLSPEELVTLCPPPASPRVAYCAPGLYVGEALRAARRRAGLSPAQVCAALTQPGASCGTYSLWERGCRPVLPARIRELSSLLRVPLDELTGGIPLDGDEVLTAPRRPPVAPAARNASQAFRPTILPAQTAEK